MGTCCKQACAHTLGPNDFLPLVLHSAAPFFDNGKSLQEHNDQPDAVKRFEQFMLEHGERGGWTAEEHSEFEGILRACDGDYDIAIQICDQQMLGPDHNAIVAHARSEWALAIQYAVCGRIVIMLCKMCLHADLPWRRMPCSMQQMSSMIMDSGWDLLERMYFAEVS